MARSCSRYSRPLRGVAGGVIGGLVGATVGAGVMFALMAKAASNPDNESAFSTLAWGPISLWGLGVIGLGTGAYIGARKPEC